MSYHQIYYHIIFGTKYHKNTIPDDLCEELYKYIWGVIKNKNCHLYRINGTPNHLHILSDLHPSVSLAIFVRDIKRASSIWLGENPNFPDFNGWAKGYAALTKAHKDKDAVVEYIKNQKEHHKKETFDDEYRRFLKENGISFDEKYLFE
jgi:REP element-mobilizing transposase RayT